MAQSGKKTQLDDLGFLRVLGGQYFQRVVDLEDLLVIGGRFEGGLLQFHPLLSATVTQGLFAASAINENPPHRLGGGAKKMGAVLPAGVTVTDEAQPGFMDECRR